MGLAKGGTGGHAILLQRLLHWAVQVADLIRRARPHCRTLLGVGWGAGEDARYLSEIHGVEVGGVDPSPEMIARTRAKCPRSTRFIGGTLQRAAVAAAWLLIACARPVTGGGGGPAAGPPLPLPPARVDDSAIAARDGASLARLDITFGTSGALPQAADATLAARAARFRAFVRARADQDAFYDTLLPRYFKMIGAAHFPLLSSGMVLASKTEAGRTYYYHPKDGPCASQHQVAVHPWWDLETTVWVCDASYRPAILVRQSATIRRTASIHGPSPAPAGAARTSSTAPATRSSTTRWRPRSRKSRSGRSSS